MYIIGFGWNSSMYIRGVKTNLADFPILVQKLIFSSSFFCQFLLKLSRISQQRLEVKRTMMEGSLKSLKKKGLHFLERGIANGMKENGGL
jgi:hypothetical protein